MPLLQYDSHLGGEGMRIFKVINLMMKKHVGFVILSLITGTLTILSSVGMLSTSSILISRAALHPEVLDLMVLIVAVRFFSLSRGVFRYLERLLSHNTTLKILSSIRTWFYRSFNENYSENNLQFKTGDIYTKLVNDVDSLKEFYLRGVSPIIIALLTGLITSLFISYFSMILSLTYLLFFFFLGFLLPAILFKLKNSLINTEGTLKKAVNLVVLDMLEGAFEISLYSLREDFTKKYNSLSKKLSKVQEAKNFITTVGDNIYSFLVSLLIALSLFEIAPMVTEGSLSGIYYAMLPLTIMASFEALIPMPNILYKFSEAINAGKNIFSIIDYSVHEPDHCSTKINSCHLTVHNLAVMDETSKEYIIKNISFELPPEKKLALVGLSGSGKSTVLKTLLGFVRYDEGDIRIGDKSFSSMNIENIREYFTYLEQDPYIFNAAIKENLLIADIDLDSSALMDTLEKMQIMDLIRQLPQGLNSMLGQNGSKVSGGEKQRLALARTFLRDRPIVLLDEPTAGLDVQIEKKVIASILKAIESKSCIWVTHRLIAMEKMDEILVINKGQILERGTHKELLDKKGFYHKLWTIQQHVIEQI
jgi:ATP-binding cassette, subfamily C, bacterial CydC